eukprot:CAMPEP_0114052756 /NCGR_PEP_ID=MMETSP1339-20121228/77232_1 /TAXON_ID=94617 /ORGANISM="Fibrocapsa japonica" /LENGTH=40 /assembly_acc=CAM_ASM_000762
MAVHQQAAAHLHQQQHQQHDPSLYDHHLYGPPRHTEQDLV